MRRPRCPGCDRVMQGVYIYVGSPCGKQKGCWSNIEGVWFCRRCVAIYDGGIGVTRLDVPLPADAGGKKVYKSVSHGGFGNPENWEGGEAPPESGEWVAVIRHAMYIVRRQKDEVPADVG